MRSDLLAHQVPIQSLYIVREETSCVTKDCKHTDQNGWACIVSWDLWMHKAGDEAVLRVTA